MNIDNSISRVFRKMFLAVIFLTILFTFISYNLFAQSAEDTTDGRFHDDLLNHLVGKWDITAVAHGFSSTATLEAKWVFNHQHLDVHFIGNEVVPWIGVPMEFEYFIGYKHSNKRYVVHSMNVFGDDDYEGFCYAYRNGNEISLVQQEVGDSTILQRFTWLPVSNTWHIESRAVKDGKEASPFLEMKLVAAKPSSTKMKPVAK